MSTTTNPTPLFQALADALETRNLGRVAWDPAPQCPRGHGNPEWDGDDHGVSEPQPIGALCSRCVSEWVEAGYQESMEQGHRRHFGSIQNAHDPRWNPELRIGRIPKNFLDHTVLTDALRAWSMQDRHAPRPWSLGYDDFHQDFFGSVGPHRFLHHRDPAVALYAALAQALGVPWAVPDDLVVPRA